MFQKVKKVLSKIKANRKISAEAKRDLKDQADLADSMMWTIGLAMKLDLRVVIRVEVGNLTHCFSVHGEEDPTLQYLYEVGKATYENAIGANLDDLDDNGVGRREKR